MPYIGNIVQDFSVNNAMLNTDSVTSIKIDDGTIVNADINDSAAIAMSKLALSITNSEVNASAAIAVSKLANFVTNNAANRVITGSGTTNTLNGNSDLLWNGSRLDIDTGGTEDALRIGSSSGADTFIRLGSINTTADTHAVIKYDIDDNYLSLLVSGESHGNGGMLIANGGAVSLSAGTSPLAKLHVKDDIYVKGSSGDGSTGIQIRSGSSAISGQHQVRTGGGLGNMLIINAAGATGLLQVQTNGTEKLRIDSSGRVGIGTSSPQEELHISADTPVIRLTDSSTDRHAQFVCIDGSLRLDADNNNAQSSTNISFRTDGSERMRIDSSGRVGINETSPVKTLDMTGEGGGNGEINVKRTSGATCMIQAQASVAVFGSSSNHRVDLKSNGTLALTINTSQNIGVGTSSPTYTNALFGGTQRTFHLTGTTAPQLRIQSNTSGQADLLLQAGNSSAIAYIANAASGGDLFFSTNDGGSQGTRFAIKDDGKIGIGTTSPSTLLELSGSGNAILTVNTGNNSGDNSQIAFGDSADADVGFINYDHGTNVMQFRVNGSERMRINSVGQLQIGDTTAADTSEMLKVDGAGASDHCGIGVKTSNNVHDGYIAFHDSDANFRGQVRYDHSVDAMFFNTAATERVRIDSSGNVGIGGTAPNYQLHVVSSIGIGSHGFAQQISISNQRIQSLLLGTGYRTLILNGLGGDIVMGSGTTQRFAFGTNDGLKYAGFGPAHGAAQDVGLNFFTTSNAGTTFVNHFRIDHNGDLFGTDTSISSISDSRVKTNITNYTYDLTKFKQFTPKQFDWKNPEYHGEKTNLKGFLAQDLEAIDTQWVGSSFIQKDNPDYDLVDKSKDGEDEDVGVAKTSKFGDKDAMYISVINQMITKIETLETKVAALEAA